MSPRHGNLIFRKDATTTLHQRYLMKEILNIAGAVSKIGFALLNTAVISTQI